MREGNEQQAYLLLLRWVECVTSWPRADRRPLTSDRLVVTYLSTHPERFQPENSTNLSRAQQRAPLALRTLEQLKPRLNARYESYVAARREREQRQNDTTPRLSSAPSPSSSSSSRRKNAPGALDLSM